VGRASSQTHVGSMVCQSSIAMLLRASAQKRCVTARYSGVDGAEAALDTLGSVDDSTSSALSMSVSFRDPGGGGE
jgi:hypothetical protein